MEEASDQGPLSATEKFPDQDFLSSDEDSTVAPPEKRGRPPGDSDSDDFEAVAAQVASNWIDGKSS